MDSETIIKDIDEIIKEERLNHAKRKLGINVSLLQSCLGNDKLPKGIIEYLINQNAEFTADVERLEATP